MANLTFNASGFAYVGNATQNIGLTGGNAAFVAAILTLGADFAVLVQFISAARNVASGTYHFIQHDGAISYLNGSASNFQVANAVLPVVRSPITRVRAARHPRSRRRRVSRLVRRGRSRDQQHLDAQQSCRYQWKANTNGSAVFYFIDGTDPAATGGIGDAVLFSDAAGAAHSGIVDIPAMLCRSALPSMPR